MNIAKLDIVIKYHAFKPEEIRHQKQTVLAHSCNQNYIAENSKFKMNVKTRKVSQLHENNRLLVGDVGFLNDEGFRFCYSDAPPVTFHNARSIFNENRNLKNFKEGRNYENHGEPYNRNKKNRKRRNRSRYTYKHIPFSFK